VIIFGHCFYLVHIYFIYGVVRLMGSQLPVLFDVTFANARPENCWAWVSAWS